MTDLRSWWKAAKPRLIVMQQRVMFHGGLQNHAYLILTPYLCSCLKLYLTIAVSIASSEKSFSKLKMTKLFLRKLDFEDIIAVFPSTKAYKVQF